MPSLYEGFGIAALEAAAAGLPLFLSRNIPKDFEFYTKCTYLSVDDSPEDWASSIIKNTYLCSERKSGAEEVIKAGYDISENRRAIEELYKENAL
jgi:glycosyltransferase involved in cell wall biosynthesis